MENLKFLRDFSHHIYALPERGAGQGVLVLVCLRLPLLIPEQKTVPSMR